MAKSATLLEAKRLYDLGFAILWLQPRDKRPVGAKWTEGPRKSWDELERTFKPNYNVGVRTGTPSKIGNNYLACIDVDVKDPSYKKVALERLKAITDGKSSPTVRSGGGSGSRHVYVLTPRPFKMVTVHKEKGWEICIYSDGRQMALPPSIHPSGRKYEWKNDNWNSWELLNIDVDSIEGDRAKATTVLEDFTLAPVELGWLDISSEVLTGITEGTGVTDRSAFLMKASNALFSSGLSRNEVLTVLTDPKLFIGKVGYEHTQSSSRKKAANWVYRYTAKSVEAERTDTSVFAHELPSKKLSKEEQAKQAEEIKEDVPWQQTLIRNKDMKTRVCLKNLDIILTNLVSSHVFIEDHFAGRIAYGVDTPWGTKEKDYIEDIDMTRVKRWLSDSEFGIEPSRDALMEVTSLIADRRKVHPVREWLTSLKWDGEKRIDRWIRDLCQGKAAEPYLSEVSRKFLLAMVKRVFEPGCQWDYVLVLEGRQGRYKSSIARAIAGDAWFMDNLPDLKDKDSMLNLQGKWLIELGELADVKRADYNQVKAYLVRRTDTVRPHYGRLRKDVPRQSVFIGTINEGQYLKDPTGNRRYWPVKVGKCDVKGLLAVRNQLFAEAMHIYRTTDEVLMLGPVANRQATRAQEERRVDDDETEMRDALILFIHSEPGKKFHWDHFRTRDLMTGISAPWGPWLAKGYAMNIAAHILMGLGFDRKRTKGARFWSQSDAQDFL